MANNDCNEAPEHVLLLEDLMIVTALARGVSVLLEHANGFEKGRRDGMECRGAAEKLAEHMAERGDAFYMRLSNFIDRWM